MRNKEVQAWTAMFRNMELGYYVYIYISVHSESNVVTPTEVEEIVNEDKLFPL